MADAPAGLLEVRRDGDVSVARFTVPQLTDDQNIEQLAHELFLLADESAGPGVVVDLSGVDYVTSSVLGKIITLHRRLHRASRRLVLCGIGEGTGRILRASRLFDYFHTAGTLDEARAALG